MTTRPLRTSIAALLAASVLLAGCNDDDKDSKDAKEPGSDASSSSGTTGSPTDEGSSDTGSTGAAPAGELDKDTFYPEVLRAQQDAGSYRTTTTTSTAGITIVADGEVTYADGKPKAHSKSTPDSPQQVESVVADGIVYLKGDGFGIPAGKWLKIDPNDPATADSPLAGLAAAADPETLLQAMGSLQSLKVVGDETVDGTETTHYKAALSTAGYAETLRLPKDALKGLPATIPFDMWLDEDNLPVKYVLEVSASGITSSTEVTYSDYGTDVDVAVPDKASTVGLDAIGLG